MGARHAKECEPEQVEELDEVPWISFAPIRIKNKLIKYTVAHPYEDTNDESSLRFKTLATEGFQRLRMNVDLSIKLCNVNGRVLAILQYDYNSMDSVWVNIGEDGETMTVFGWVSDDCLRTKSASIRCDIAPLTIKRVFTVSLQ